MNRRTDYLPILPRTSVGPDEIPVLGGLVLISSVNLEPPGLCCWINCNRQWNSLSSPLDKIWKVGSGLDADANVNQRTNGPVNAHLRPEIYTNKLV